MGEAKYSKLRGLAEGAATLAASLTALLATEAVKTPLERLQLHRQLRANLTALDLAFPPLLSAQWRLAWRGLGLNMLQSLLTAHFYTWLYPSTRQALRAHLPGEGWPQAAAATGAGLFVTLLSAAALYPLDLAKTLVMCSPQLEWSQGFHGTLTAVGRVFSLYGVRRLYHGFACYLPLAVTRVGLCAAALLGVDASRGPELPLLAFLAVHAATFPLDTLLRKVQIQIYSQYVPPEPTRRLLAAQLRANPLPGLGAHLARHCLAALPVAAVARSRFDDK